MSKVVESLKPLSCRIKDNTAHAVFDREELGRYVTNTEDAILWIEDVEGNRAPIRVGFLRETSA